MTPGLRWPIGVTVVLAATVGANMALMYVAGDDPSFAIVPNYYQKAVAWDSTLAQEARSRALGWRLSPSVTLRAGDPGAHLAVQLTDRSGAALAGATVKVSALFVGDANHVVTATCAPAAATQYAADLPIRHAGLWELNFTVIRGSDRFVSATRLNVSPVGAPGAPDSPAPPPGSTSDQETRPAARAQ